MKHLGKIKVIVAGFDSGLPPEGLWISPEGEAFPISEHLIGIAERPQDFGISPSQLPSTSDPDHRTKLRELAEGLIAKGWTRYRYMGGIYHFEVDSLRRRIRLIDDILAKADAYEKEPVTISSSDGSVVSGTVGDVQERAIFKMASKKPDKWAWSSARFKK